MTIGRIDIAVIWILLLQNAMASINHTATEAKYHKFYVNNSSNKAESEKITASLVSQAPDCSHNQQWFCFNSTSKTYNCLYGSFTQLRCSEYGPLLKLGYCSEDTGLLSIPECRYFHMRGYNITVLGDGYYIYLPKTLAELNDSMCGPMNRKGIVCSQCIDGFGPSVTSIGYTCANCTDHAWYRVPLFLVLLFAPITVFYLFILTFQISMTSPPMPCFIMYAQVTVMGLYFVDLNTLKSVQAILYDNGDLKL
jgi:hypothetical protein